MKFKKVKIVTVFMCLVELLLSSYFLLWYLIILILLGCKGLKLNKSAFGEKFLGMRWLKILRQNAKMLTFILKIIAYSFYKRFGENILL